MFTFSKIEQIIFITLKLMSSTKCRQPSTSTNLFIVALIATLSVSSSFDLPYAPPPTVNVTKILKLNKSAQESRFIGSKRLQVLEVTQNAVTSTTTFKLSFFNRSATNLMNTYLIQNESGTWTHLRQTSLTLSCNLVYDTKNSIYGFLLFLNQQGTFKILSKISLADVKSLIPSAYNNSLNYSQIGEKFTLGENCKLISLFDALYDFSNSSKLTKATVPSGWVSTSYSEGLQFGVTSNQLFRFNTTSRQYDVAYNFSTPEKAYETYSIKQHRGRIIVTASYVVQTQGTTNKIIQDNYIFQVTKNGSTTSLISKSRINGSADGGKFFEVQVSSQSTKFAFGYMYTPSNDTQRHIYVKSIDQNNNKIFDLTFSNQTQADISFTYSPIGSFTFNDDFLVVRSENPSEPVEESYQMIGKKIVYFSKRTLTDAMELNLWKIIAIDHYFRDRLVVLNAFEATDGSIDVYQAQYGNYRDTTRIVTPTVPNYIQYEQPKNTFKQPLNPQNFTWGFYDITPGVSSNMTILRINPFGSDHIDKLNQFVPGNMQYIARSVNCRIFYEALTNQGILYAFDSPGGQATNVFSLNSIIGSITVSPTEKWYVSDKCDRFSYKNKIFTFFNNTYIPLNNDFSTFNWKAIDSDMNFVVKDGQIWKLNKSQNIFVKYSTNASILANPIIYSYQNIVFVIATNSSTAPVDFQALAYIDNNSTLTPFFNYRSVFTSVPAFDTSNFLTNFVVYGKKGSAQVIDLFEIDYANKKNITIAFPYQTIRDFDKTLIKVFDSHLYVRQIHDPSKSTNTTYTSVNQQEFAYYLNYKNDKYVPQLLIKRDLTADQASKWVQTLIVSVNEAQFFLATQSNQKINDKNNVIVRVIQLDPKQANLNNMPNQDVQGYVVNGTVYVCPKGCSDCVETTSVCTACKKGYTLVASSALCLACASGCSSCDPFDKNKCYSCVDRTYLKDNQCLPCDDSCKTCNGSATSCNTCIHGKIYSSDSKNCVQCPRNCLICSNKTTCTTCNRGFIVLNGNCSVCSIYCSECNQTDITQCTACGKGMQLASGKCVKCPQKCLQCSNNTCTTCIQGYNANSNGSCVPICKYPCATCTDNQPTVCTSCFGSSSLNNGSCAPNLDCNKTGTCADCGQGYGYFLLEKYCYSCQDLSNIPNCIQCSQTSPQVCATCNDGFYPDSTGCAACNTSCTTCIGNNLCTACQSGYTLFTDQTIGQCQKCVSPCLTCMGTPSFCITCIANFTLKGWKCQNDSRVTFSFTLKAERSAVLAKTDDLAASLLTLIGEDPTKKQRVTFQTFDDGSLKVAGSLEPQAGASAGAQALSSKLSSNTQLAGFDVTSYSVVATNTDTTTNTSSSSDENKVGLIAGLTIGLFAFAVIVAVIIFCYFKRRNQNADALGSVSEKEIVSVPASGSQHADFEMKNVYYDGRKY